MWNQKIDNRDDLVEMIGKCKNTRAIGLDVQATGYRIGTIEGVRKCSQFWFTPDSRKGWVKVLMREFSDVETCVVRQTAAIEREDKVVYVMERRKVGHAKGKEAAVEAALEDIEAGEAPHQDDEILADFEKDGSVEQVDDAGGVEDARGAGGGQEGDAGKEQNFGAESAEERGGSEADNVGDVEMGEGEGEGEEEGGSEPAYLFGTYEASKGEVFVSWGGNMMWQHNLQKGNM